MYSFEDFCSIEHKELLEPVIELIEEYSEGYDDYCSVNENGYHHKTDVYKITSYAYKLGRVHGRKMFSEDELPELYKAAFKDLKLDNIIKTYADREDEWILTDIWQAKDLTITTEAIRHLYFTESEKDRLDILERAVEASQMVDIPVIDSLCIRLCRECLQFEKEDSKCLS